MKTKPTLYVVDKYDDTDNNILERKVFHIHKTDLNMLLERYNSKEYSIAYGRHTKRGKVCIFGIMKY